MHAKARYLGGSYPSTVFLYQHLGLVRADAFGMRLRCRIQHMRIGNIIRELVTDGLEHRGCRMLAIRILLFGKRLWQPARAAQPRHPLGSTADGSPFDADPIATQLLQIPT